MTKKTINVYVFNIHRNIYEVDLKRKLRELIKKLTKKLKAISMYHFVGRVFMSPANKHDNKIESPAEMEVYTECINYFKQILKDGKKTNEIVKIIKNRRNSNWKNLTQSEYRDSSLRYNAKHQVYWECYHSLDNILRTLIGEFREANKKKDEK